MCILIYLTLKIIFWKTFATSDQLPTKDMDLGTTSVNIGLESRTNSAIPALSAMDLSAKNIDVRLIYLTIILVELIMLYLICR